MNLSTMNLLNNKSFMDSLPELPLVQQLYEDLYNSKPVNVASQESSLSATKTLTILKKSYVNTAKISSKQRRGTTVSSVASKWNQEKPRKLRTHSKHANELNFIGGIGPKIGYRRSNSNVIRPTEIQKIFNMRTQNKPIFSFTENPREANCVPKKQNIGQKLTDKHLINLCANQINFNYNFEKKTSCSTMENDSIVQKATIINKSSQLNEGEYEQRKEYFKLKRKIEKWQLQKYILNETIQNGQDKEDFVQDTNSQLNNEEIPSEKVKTDEEFMLSLSTDNELSVCQDINIHSKNEEIQLKKGTTEEECILPIYHKAPQKLSQLVRTIDKVKNAEKLKNELDRRKTKIAQKLKQEKEDKELEEKLQEQISRDNEENFEFRKGEAAFNDFIEMLKTNKRNFLASDFHKINKTCEIGKPLDRNVIRKTAAGDKKSMKSQNSINDAAQSIDNEPEKILELNKIEFSLDVHDDDDDGHQKDFTELVKPNIYKDKMVNNILHVSCVNNYQSSVVRHSKFRDFTLPRIKYIKSNKINESEKIDFRKLGKNSNKSIDKPYHSRLAVENIPAKGKFLNVIKDNRTKNSLKYENKNSKNKLGKSDELTSNLSDTGSSSNCTNFTGDSGSFLLLQEQKIYLQNIPSPKEKISIAKDVISTSSHCFDEYHRPYKIPECPKKLSKKHTLYPQYDIRTRLAVEIPKFEVEKIGISKSKKYNSRLITEWNENYQKELYRRPRIRKFRPRTILSQLRGSMRKKFEAFYIQEFITESTNARAKEVEYARKVTEFRDFCEPLFVQWKETHYRQSMRKMQALQPLYEETDKLKNQLNQLRDQFNRLNMDIIYTEDKLRHRTILRNFHFMLKDKNWRKRYDWVHKKENGKLENYRESIESRYTKNVRIRNEDSSWAVLKYYENVFYANPLNELCMIAFTDRHSFMEGLQKLRAQSYYSLLQLHFLLWTHNFLENCK